MIISQADRLEAFDDGIVVLNHKVDLLAVRIESIEKSAATTNNWLRALFAVFFVFDSAILVLLLQSR